METLLMNPSTSNGFAGKTFNKHPQWYNQPLRLTEEQLTNPILAFVDFFECYHLNETREVLWQWLQAVIVSPGSISNEPLERSNHLYFYERIEEIIEAAFVIITEQSPTDQNTTSKADVNSIQPEITTNSGEILNKEKQLIEYAVDDPLYVLKAVFDPGRWCFISIALKEWLYIGLSSDDYPFSEADDRQDLIIFNDHLLLLVEALFILTLQNILDAAEKERYHNIYTPTLLSSDQKARPTQVLTSFFEKYQSQYISRQLEDWLEAGVGYTGPWRNEITCAWHVLDTYRDVLCLIRVAEQLLKQDYSTLFTSEV